MQFHPSSDGPIPDGGVGEDRRVLPPVVRTERDTLMPIWRRTASAARVADIWKRPPRLIDLERRAHFARAGFDVS